MERPSTQYYGPASKIVNGSSLPHPVIGRVYAAWIHAQSGTTRRRVRLLRTVPEVPGFVVVEDADRAGQKFCVHWLKLEIES